MLGARQVAGLPWPTLRDSLLSGYALQLKNPSVILTPLRRVQVLGEVTRPGQYFADPTLSIAGLVALAGGATPEGDLRRVRVVRNGRTNIPSESIETLVLGSGVLSNDQVFVGKRPWLERNGAFLASAIISTTSIVITLIRQ
jgi:protein involved in polysaccharide export with SLBB domain